MVADVDAVACYCAPEACTDPGSRRAVVAALAFTGAHSDRLAEMLRDPDPGVRRADERRPRLFGHLVDRTDPVAIAFSADNEMRSVTLALFRTAPERCYRMTNSDSECVPRSPGPRSRLRGARQSRCADLRAPRREAPAGPGSATHALS